MLNWERNGIVLFSDNEADVLTLQECGYRAGLIPEDNQPIERDMRGDHYILLANGRSKDIAQKWAAAGLCPEWQISVIDYCGYQDLSHVFADGGEPLVSRFVEHARSIYHDEEHAFADIPPREEKKSYLTGWDFMHPYLRWTFPELVVQVGPYGSGKSALGQMLACDFADKAGRELDASASICAWEDADWRVKRNIERFAQTREMEDGGQDVAGRVNFLLNKVRHIWLPAQETRSIDWYLSRCELQIKRYNTRFFEFDPWNQFDHVRDGKDTETEYTNKILREIDSFASTYNVIMTLISHVSGKSFNDDGKIKPFRIAQTQGSSHFGKMAMRGICVMRTRQFQSGLQFQNPVPEHGESRAQYEERRRQAVERANDRMVIRFDKAKDEETMGEVGALACKFDRDGMSLIHDPIASTEASKLWQY
jgi:hypothetical protein